MTPSRNKVGTSFRLSPVAMDLIVALAKHLGVSQASVVEMAVRKMATAEGIQERPAEEQTSESER